MFGIFRVIGGGDVGGFCGGVWKGPRGVEYGGGKRRRLVVGRGGHRWALIAAAAALFVMQN